MGLRLAAAVLCLVLARGALAAGEIYTWTDARGNLHATRNLLEVPRQHRAAARRQAQDRQPSRLQTYARPEATAAAESSPATALALHGETLQIPFQRRGTLMVVDVLLDDHVRAPFLVDTGASGISIPYAVARELGIRIDADTPRMAVQTAAGMVSEPVIRLESVQVGGARVEGLEALVNSSMDIGLLGGTFFNNFVYQVDAAHQVITLRLNDAVRGGMSAPQWTERFRELRSQETGLTRYLEQNREGLSEGRREELESSLERVREAMDALHREANAAGVPRGWRD